MNTYQRVSVSKSPKFYDFFPNFYRRIFFTSDDQNGRFQNRVISGNLGKIARFAIRVIPGIVLIKFVLFEELLSTICHFCYTGDHANRIRAIRGSPVMEFAQIGT